MVREQRDHPEVRVVVDCNTAKLMPRSAGFIPQDRP